MPNMLAKRKVPFKTASDTSFRVMATINHDTEPKKKRIYPKLNNAIATIKLPKIEQTVPNHAKIVIIIIPCSDKGQALNHIVP